MELPLARILSPGLPTVESKPAPEKSLRTAKRTLFRFFPHRYSKFKSSPLSVPILAQPHESHERSGSVIPQIWFALPHEITFKAGFSAAFDRNRENFARFVFEAEF